MASLAVATPGSSEIPAPCAPAASAGVRPGDTANCAPASRTACSCSTFSTVPAPTQACGSAAATALMASSATGVRSVISSSGRPPVTSASLTCRASSTEWNSSTGITGTSARR
ncbi:hypothetical protein D3C72_1925000 [compost metagenome]